MHDIAWRSSAFGVGLFRWLIKFSTESFILARKYLKVVIIHFILIWRAV